MPEEKPSGSNTHAPKDIKQIDPGNLGITWTDGHESVYSVRHLRESCPCANCIDEWTGEKRLDPNSIPDNIRPTKLHSVGLYAIQFSWTDGHDTGLYTWPILYELGSRYEAKWSQYLERLNKEGHHRTEDMNGREPEKL